MDVDNWYFSNRGIRSDTLDACGIHRDANSAWWSVGGAKKIRTGFGVGDRAFRFEGKPDKVIWWTPGNEDSEIVIIPEGETDAMRLNQELKGSGIVARVGALSGVNFYDKNTFSEIADKSVYFIFDNDENDYANKAVNDSWNRIRKLVPNARRVYLTTGYNDLCDWFDVYDTDNLQELLNDSKKTRFQYEALDLTKASEPPVWLWDTKMARGDIITLQASPNTGKSMIMTALAVAMAEGHGSFLGFDLVTGRALIIDEENPEDEARRRVWAYGLTSTGLPNLRYVHEQAVRLDRGHEKLYAEAEAFQPDLIVLDSLTRLHTENENDAGAVSRLFNDGIKPLARKLGATVVIIHHINKTQSGDSFIRSRGSSDIGGAPDAGYDLVEHRFHDGPVVALTNFKNRRGPKNSRVYFRIEDQPDGKLAIVRQMEESGIV